MLTSSTGVSAVIRPYDGSDAQTVIQTVNSRGQHMSNPSRTHNPRSASMSAFPSAHGRINSAGAINGNGGGFRPNGQQSLNNTVSIPPNLNATGREPSPTLPSLPSHPTLNSLISSSLGEAVARDNTLPTDPAIVAAGLHPEGMSGPRIGDSGKRMLGAALGVRHPALGLRLLNGMGTGSPGTSPSQGNGVDHAMRGATSGLVVE
jgi:hypothetical protein